MPSRPLSFSQLFNEFHAKTAPLTVYHSACFAAITMILHGDGPLRHILGELTNTVYEEPTIDDFGEHGQLLSKGDGEVCPYTLFLGIFVSLLPKVPMK